MRRVFGLSVLVALVMALPASAQQDEVIRDRKVSEWLKMLRADKDVKHRRLAIIALEVAGPKALGVVPGLIDALEKEPDADLRREVVLTLGRMGHEAKGAAEALGDALKNDKSDDVKEAAARALGGRMAEKGHGQILTLGMALKASHEGTRVAAAESLRDLGEKARAALPQIVEALKNKQLDRFTRLYVAQVVGKFTEDIDMTAPLLVTLLEDSEAHISVREAAIESLGRLGAESAIPVLAKTLEITKDPKTNPPVELRRAAAVALIKMGDKAKSVWPPIKGALGDPDVTVRSQAIRLAGGLGRDIGEVVPALAEISEKDISPDNRLAAIEELGSLGRAAARAIGTLTRLRDEDSRVAIRKAAAAALKRIQGS